MRCCSREKTDAAPGVLNVARWHAALATSDAGYAARTLRRAIDEIDAAENDFARLAVRVVLGVAAAGTTAASARGAGDRASRSSRRRCKLRSSCSSTPPNRTTTESSSILRRGSRVRRLKVRRHVLAVDVMRGEVRRGSEAVHVSDRGLELLVALALAPAGARREDLAARSGPGSTARRRSTRSRCASRERARSWGKKRRSAARKAVTRSASASRSTCASSKNCCAACAALKSFQTPCAARLPGGGAFAGGSRALLRRRLDLVRSARASAGGVASRTQARTGAGLAATGRADSGRRAGFTRNSVTSRPTGTRLGPL